MSLKLDQIYMHDEIGAVSDWKRPKQQRQQQQQERPRTRRKTLVSFAGRPFRLASVLQGAPFRVLSVSLLVFPSLAAPPPPPPPPAPPQRLVVVGLARMQRWRWLPAPARASCGQARLMEAASLGPPRPGGDSFALVGPVGGGCCCCRCSFRALLLLLFRSSGLSQTVIGAANVVQVMLAGSDCPPAAPV